MIQPFQQRVLDEKIELDVKIKALAQFIDTETFEGLPDAEQVRLNRQVAAMADYSQILHERIGEFTATPAPPSPQSP